MSPLRLAYLSLTRRKVPTFIALLAIAIAVAFSGVLLRLYFLSGARFSTFARGGDAIIGAKAGGIEILLGSLNLEGNYPDFLPYKLYASLKAGRNVKFEDGAEAVPSYIETAIPILFFGKFHDYRVVGTDEGFVKRGYDDDVPTFAQGQWLSGSGEAVLGAEVARREGVKIGDSIPIDLWTGDKATDRAANAAALKVSGIFDATGTSWDSAVFADLAQGQALLRNVDLGERSIWKGEVLHYFLMYLKPDGFAPLKALINKRTVAQVISVPEEKARLEDLTGSGRRLGFLMTILIMCLGGLSVAGMLITRFEAMNTQFAVLRALGIGKKVISRWLLWEGALLGFGACVLGGIGDAILFPILCFTLRSALPASPLISAPIYLSAPVWIAAILATTLAVFVPLSRLYSQDIHVALKGF